MTIHQNFPLTSYNTFHITANAAYFTEINQKDDLIKLYEWPLFQQLPRLVLGGGSNILLTSDFDGLVIKMNLDEFKIVKENASQVWIRSGAGTNWHEFVRKIINLGYGGIENLSLIPGTVGAAPMQNIGAYGVEIQQVFDCLEGWNMTTGAFETFDREACQFGYRYSVFKGERKNQYLITAVTLRLDKIPQFVTTYGAISKVLQQKQVKELSLHQISEAVIEIRQSKLPDPEHLGNAGSFFKNPVIPKDKYDGLKKHFPDLSGYEISDFEMKVSAAWLIDQCGWRGYRTGDAGIYAKHALILVNFGNATGQQIWKLAQQVRQSVLEKFDITLEPEVNIV
ncbi:MAG: UDP-N-acetylmuramate dehydrogenase [Candidatus Cyclobacteriaceae bacterium M3_2C_046]